MKHEISKEKFEALAAEHGGPECVARCETVIGTLVFRKPTRGEFRVASKAGIMDPKSSPEAFEILARATNVFPGREALDTALEAHPALALQCGEELLKLAGLTGEDLGKKLFRW